MCFSFIRKRLEWPHPQLVHWWLLVHSSRYIPNIETGINWYKGWHYLSSYHTCKVLATSVDMRLQPIYQTYISGLYIDI
jgi:hypothetical protein